MMTCAKRRCLALALLAACVTSVQADDKKAAAGPSLDSIKQLAGDWVLADKDGKPTDQIASNIRVTANGSAVLETMFPGSPHEMVTLYYMNGKDLVLVHYCGLGNQPRMKAQGGAKAGEIVFKFDGGDNTEAGKATHMHEATFQIVSPDNFKTAWVNFQDGKANHHADFNLVRKKK